MPSFQKGPNLRHPFGVNEYLRSTQDVKTESYMVAASTVASQTIDAIAGQKNLRSGTWMALITSGDEEGKVGPLDTTASDGREDTANIVGTNNTDLPWQTMDRDVEIAVVYEATVYQARTWYYLAGVPTMGLTDALANDVLVGSQDVADPLARVRITFDARDLAQLP